MQDFKDFKENKFIRKFKRIYNLRDFYHQYLNFLFLNFVFVYLNL